MQHVKYSQDPDRYPIRPSDLAEICTSFLLSTQRWSDQLRSTTYYRVITNRSISPTLRLVMDTSGGQRAHEQFHSPELVALLQRTEILPDVDFSTWMTALKHFANEYGVEPEEFDAGIDRLIGEFVRQASARQASVLRREDIARVFRGYEHPRKLTVAAIRSHTADHWESLKDRRDQER